MLGPAPRKGGFFSPRERMDGELPGDLAGSEGGLREVLLTVAYGLSVPLSLFAVWFVTGSSILH
jgi:hypothetical protein